jgi:imidazole glycerol-phosphate synthase subunit HisH
MHSALVVLDYGAGNLASFEGALARLGIPHVRAHDASQVPAGAVLVLPGVGHFAAAKRALVDRGLWALLQNEGRSRGVLGICLGLQLLAKGSAEAEGESGLGLLDGVARKFESPLKVPHMGWNEVVSAGAHPAFDDAPSWAYFVHSYALPVSAQTTATSSYGEPFTASAASGRVLGMQHHPERSSSAGLRSLARALHWLAAPPTLMTSSLAPEILG